MNMTLPIRRGEAPAILFLTLSLLSGCRSIGARGHREEPGLPGNAMIRTELYFGMSRRSGDSVTEAEWGRFLDTAVTRRFPDGLTVVDAHGQWRAGNGSLARERTRLVIILHDGNGAFDRIRELIDSYKRSFDQESVLQVNAAVHAEF